MTTVADMLNQSLRDIGVIAAGETASAEDTQDALSTLNQMLGLWQADGLSVYAQQETSFATSGASTYAIGTGATIDTTRPIAIESAFYRSGGIDTPIAIIGTFNEFERISSKTQAGEPSLLFYRPSHPNGTVYLYPQPTSGTVHLVTLIDLPEYTSAADSLALPRSYELPVRYNLDVMLAATMGATIRPEIVSMAINAKKLLQRKNVRIPQMDMPAVLRACHSDIYQG